MATNHQPHSPGGSRLYLYVSKDRNLILRFYPHPSKGLSEGKLVEAFKELNQPNAEHALKTILPEGFCQEAEERGVSLIECITVGKVLLRGLNNATKNLTTDEQLASILGDLAPGLDPHFAVLIFQRFLGKRGKFAIKILRDREDRLGLVGKDRRTGIRVPSALSQNSSASSRY